MHCFVGWGPQGSRKEINFWNKWSHGSLEASRPPDKRGVQVGKMSEIHRNTQTGKKKTIKGERNRL